MAVDGSFSTARQVASGKMAKELDAKTASINRERARVTPEFQVRHFPERFAGIPPVLIMETASAASVGDLGAHPKSAAFSRWIEMIKSYRSARSRNGLKFDAANER